VYPSLRKFNSEGDRGTGKTSKGKAEGANAECDVFVFFFFSLSSKTFSWTRRVRGDCSSIVSCLGMRDALFGSLGVRLVEIASRWSLR
jgi:hypothetical protein